MVVQTFEITPGHAGLMGLDIGDSNVREYFPRGMEAIELELDHLCIVCALEPWFWEGRPEIHDARLSLWLEAKRMGGKLTTGRAPLAMIPTGRQAFRIEVIARDAADYALTSGRPAEVEAREERGMAPGAAVASALSLVPATVVAFDRRRTAAQHSAEGAGLID